MRVVYRLGNLSDIKKKEVQVITHQCSFNSTDFPPKEFPYADFYTDGLKRIPGNIRVKGGGKNTYICGMFAQKYTGKSNLDDDTLEKRVVWFGKCLNKISAIRNLKSIAFSNQIGEENWHLYKKIIEEWAGTLDPNICVYVYISDTYHNKTIIEYTNNNIPIGWEDFFKAVQDGKMLEDVSKEVLKLRGKIAIFPPLHQIYSAFDFCAPEEVKVILIGQDPYFNAGEAMGLCFSVPRDVRTPSSLINIYKELESDLKIPIANHGDLTSWGSQGVFMINTSLTVPEGRDNVGKHVKHWSYFMQYLFRYLNGKIKDGAVVIMWGEKAKAFRKYFSPDKFKFIESAHPSGLSANRGFFGSRPFSKTNEYLEKMGKDPIDWEIPN